MYQKSDLQFVEAFRKQLKKLNTNRQCIYPGCTKKPIGSHVIAKSALELLANAEGKVLTWEHSDNDVLVDTIHGHTWDHLYQQPKSVGIRSDVTYPIFCYKHDNDVFAALEKSGSFYEPEKIALLAYRALCYKTWNPHLNTKLELFLSNTDPETASQHERIYSLKNFVAARERFHDMLETQDYRQMCWIKRIFHIIDPCFACTDANIMFAGEQDAISIVRGNSVLTPENVVTFTFFPEKGSDVYICVITWFKDNVRGEQFIEGLQLDKSEAVVRNNIINHALQMSLVYASHSWWDSLSPEDQAIISRLQMSKITSLYDL